MQTLVESKFCILLTRIGQFCNMPEQVSLQWDDFKGHASKAFQNLMVDNDFADVTLACGDGEQIKARKGKVQKKK